MAHDVATLLDENAKLAARVAQQDALVEALKAEVVRLRRWRFGRSAEVLDAAVAPELPLAGGDTSATPTSWPSVDSAAVAPTVPKLVSVDVPNARRTVRRPARVLPPELPRVIRLHTPERCACPECGGALKRLGEDVSEQLDYVPGYFQVIRHVRPKLVCGPCARIVQAGAPSRPIERGLPTAALLAQVIGAKYADHCPLYRQEGIYRRAGVELPRAMLTSWVG